MSRATITSAIERALDGRTLVWFGTRGDDIESLRDMPFPISAFTILTLGRQPFADGASYEDLSGQRVDLESWDIDDVPAHQASEAFWDALLGSISRPSALLPYRPSMTQSLLLLSRQDQCLSLGMFANHQHAFEYKPWVETQIKNCGVTTLGWEYIAHHESERVVRMLQDGALILRRSRTSGGEGIHYLADPARVDEVWPHTHESFVSVSRYVEHAIPINIGAVVWNDGVTVHHPSVQIMGEKHLTHRRFGHCGNDFAFMKGVDGSILDTVEKHTLRVGEWMKSAGYRGAFGVDYLLTTSGEILFTEVNARFQGSTRATSELSVRSDLPCILVEHMAAMLGLPSVPRPSLREQVASAPPLAQAIAHQLSSDSVTRDPEQVLAGVKDVGVPCRVDVLPSSAVTIAPAGTVARMTFDRGIAADGHHLDDDVARVAATIQGMTG